MQPNTTYYFRVDAANYLVGYTFPSLTTSATLPVSLVSFKATPYGKEVKLEWITATEQNNDRFDIERSTNGTSWMKIASVKGSGNSTQSRSYEAFDNNPHLGLNYYRIKQYNLDGSYTISSVRSLRIGEDATLKVSPNPSHGNISFSLPNYAGKVTVTLTNLAGKQVHQETIELTQSSANYKLNLQKQPAPGLYILRIAGEGISASTKVIVE